MSLKNKTRAGVRPSDRASNFSNIDVCETSGLIAIIFYLKHHLGEGKTAFGLRQNRTRTQFSMATDNSHRVIMGENGVYECSRLFLIQSFSFLQVRRTYIIVSMT